MVCSFSSWSVRVATGARVTSRGFSCRKGTSAGSSANPAWSATLEPDDVSSVRFAISHNSKIGVP
ncbi:hypothetical protein DPMN_157804 [Dreissena polymorpha]|uniref:Uncharacterized protein n=1 Tax=Dreissena polymorpha TaxID=45954 RepID=A0A9D4EHZ1_DREPO|nr:hypothetical protein DPMN_157804 [Dreissena polymorpha]